MALTHVEEYLQKIQSVIGCKIVSDDNGAIQEIHIVSDMERSPKQILRDIEAIMLSEFNQTIDYKKVSIAQIQQDSVKTSDDPRLKLTQMSFKTFGREVEISISLEKQGEQFVATLTGINTSRNYKCMIVNTVLEAIHQYLGRTEVFMAEDVKVVQLSSVEVVLVSIVSFYRGREEILTGSAKIVSDRNEAIAKASLNAVNRQILLKSSF